MINTVMLTIVHHFCIVSTSNTAHAPGAYDAIPVNKDTPPWKTRFMLTLTTVIKFSLTPSRLIIIYFCTLWNN